MLNQTTDILTSHLITTILIAAFIILAVLTAVANYMLAKRAERLNPPKGRVVTACGVRLHYLEQGSGPALVLLHGNGSMIEDFLSSGLIQGAAKKYRVIAFDRPGFGHSERPRTTVWSPQNQAEAIHTALAEIGVSECLVLGHSWGTFVALALAMKYPQSVKALILVSGYYFPTARADVILFSAPAIPVIGDMLRYTVSPIVSPSQLRASGAESALMIPAAHNFQQEYRRLRLPVVIAAGAEDQFVESEQSAKLHGDISQSMLRMISGAGHMVHQTATLEILSAIDMAAASAAGRTRDTAAA